MTSSGTWRKSSYSSPAGGQCVETRMAGVAVQVRDSKAPELGSLAVSPSDFSALLRAVR